MAGRPYVSSRSGRFQWMMQRVSAVLLLVLVFVHFALQHFTPDAVSTGLTVAARFNNPWWQAFYVIFVVLGLYHGVNGLIGIINDYAPKQLVRGIAALVLWTAAAAFIIVGVKNILTPRPLGEVKVHYALNGFSAGVSHGSPPSVGKEYDYRIAHAELPLLRHYLIQHVHGGESVDVAAIFGDRERIPAEEADSVGSAFDDWVRSEVAKGPIANNERGRNAIFSSVYEFAVWAGNVRKVNAKQTGDEVVAGRYNTLPAYSPTLH